MYQSDYPADLPVERTRSRQLSIWWPEPLHDRLQNLVEVANRAGAKTTQRELLAAIVLGAASSEAQLDRLVKRYRRATVGACASDLASASNAKVVPLQRDRRSEPRA